jgi:hypothetical protein
MIVYGDPSLEESLSTLVERLQARVHALPQASSLDELRTLLVQAGELEQAAADHPFGLEASRLTQRCQAVTVFAASAFAGAWFALQNTAGVARPDVPCCIESLGQLLRRMPCLEQLVRVKAPEGFAYYGLFPEAYIEAALNWVQDHENASPRRVVVIGIRSTTLSAVVAATLRANGWDVHRLTVRPSGSPFARQIEIATEELAGGEWGLIVDEGPGLSGSSMAAVAEAACRAGLRRERLSFFPSHTRGPGPEASEQVRQWWAAVHSYVTSMESLRWQGRSLPEVLADRTSGLCGEPVERVEDHSGGRWREVAYSDPVEWPAVAAMFERPKYRVVLESGTAVLWKFGGISSVPGGGSGAETMFRAMSSRAGGGTEPLAVCCGFVATRWVEGERLTIGDTSPSLVGHIGRHVASVAGPALTAEEERAARERLSGMIVQNAREALGLDLSPLIANLSPAAGLPSYGDGRMAPHKWVRTVHGRIVKTDDFGHEWDHTVVGRQPVLWDVAGAVVEWGLDESAACLLVDAVRRAGISLSIGRLSFYQAAYAAFRMGQCSMGAEGGDGERERLERAFDFYREALCNVCWRRESVRVAS